MHPSSPKSLIHRMLYLAKCDQTYKEVASGAFSVHAEQQSNNKHNTNTNKRMV